MRVAIVHDWLTGMRGGERTLERMCRMFPEADVHTLVWNRGSVSQTIERHRIATSPMQHLPAAGTHYRWYLPLFPAAVGRLNLNDYDAVISSTHAVAGGAPVPTDTFHMSYVYTPMRYIWELEQDYFPSGRFPWPLSWYVRHTCARLREWDVRASRRPDTIIGISQHVADRIRRHYGREAVVVYPPVELSRFAPAGGPRDYDLLAGAFAPYKRGELAIEACERMGRRLLVVGSGQEATRLRRIAGPDVEFLGWVPEDELPRLYQGARSLIFPGEEDFGIVPVEAMASGCPVVAFGRGGAVETVGRGLDGTALDRLTAGNAVVAGGGILFPRQTVDDLCAALQLMDATTFAPETLHRQAEPFSAEAFDRGFRQAFDEGLAGFRATNA